MSRIAERRVPDFIEGYGRVHPFTGVTRESETLTRAPVQFESVPSGRSKRLQDIAAAFKACGICNGATLSFHHHMRNGDFVLNMVLEEAARLRLRDLKIAPSSIFPVHAPLVEHMNNDVVTGIYTAYCSGPVAEAISAGLLKTPAVLQTHGGRARAVESGELPIDVAFIAAPTADDYGNLNGIPGGSACGTLGYARVDVRSARQVVAVTDNLVPYPECPVEITQDFVGFVVKVPEIGDSSQILSGSTRVTEDPVGLEIARTAAQVIDVSGLLKEGFSFHTGAGGISLAGAGFVQERMNEKNSNGSFGAAGITGKIVEMLDAVLFRSLFDVQCFDLKAVKSHAENPAHQSMSASLYGNPWNRGAVVNRLDSMILGAAEIDLDFNVNVTTRSNGVLRGGPGDHADTAYGAKFAIVTTKLKAGKYPKIVKKVTTITTPGLTIDVVVTDAGVAVNPIHAKLGEKLVLAGVKIVPLQPLYELPNIDAKPLEAGATHDARRIVAVQQYREGTIVDVMRQVNSTRFK